MTEESNVGSLALTDKEQKVVEFIKSLASIEYAMEPLKEQKRDLRNSFKQQEWLTGPEMAEAVRAWRFVQKEGDVEEFNRFHEIIRRVAKGS